MRIPQNYKPALTPLQTFHAINLIKKTFESQLEKQFNLIRIPGPLIVRKDSGLNDELDGKKMAAVVRVKYLDDVEVEIVQAVSKWKRHTLTRLSNEIGSSSTLKGIWTDLRALRPDYKIDSLHSALLGLGNGIWGMIKEVEGIVYDTYPKLEGWDRERGLGRLPERIVVVEAEELAREYPDLDSHGREMKGKCFGYDHTRIDFPLLLIFPHRFPALEKHHAIFLHGVGSPLPPHNTPHEQRAPDYDDWTLNGDIIVYNPLLQTRLELSSMGIRVDSAAFKNQLEELIKRRAQSPDHGEVDWEKLGHSTFQKTILENKLVESIGGGIGQSRVFLLLLRKAHLGEVSASVWEEEDGRECEEKGVFVF